jgi:hypothetical protein
VSKAPALKRAVAFAARDALLVVSQEIVECVALKAYCIRPGAGEIPCRGFGRS